MIELNKENFDAEVLQAPGLTMVDFWSPKCEPCQALMPEVAAIAERYASQIKFCKVNAIENRRLSLSQKVLGLPVIAFYRGGEKVEELTGDITGDKVEATIKDLTQR